MTKHVLLVFTSPVEGREDEYNAWYNDVHLGEVLTADGFVRAQRFKASEMLPVPLPNLTSVRKGSRSHEL